MESKDFYISDDDLKMKTQEMMAGSWGKHAKTTLLYFVFILVLGLGIFLSVKFLDWYYSLIIIVVATILFSILNFGYNSYCLESMKSTNASTKILFCGFGRNSFKIFMLLLVKTIVVAIGLCLLIVPGIYLLIKFSQSAYVLREDQSLGVVKVLKRSSKLMKANVKRFLNMFSHFVGWFVLGIVTIGIGMLWFLPHYLVQKAVFYEDLKADF